MADMKTNKLEDSGRAGGSPRDDFGSDNVMGASTVKTTGEDVRLAKDTTQLLEIFPEEIWSMILEQPQEPSVLETISNSSLFFRKHLLDQQSLFLFPRVWGIIQDEYNKQCSQDIDSVLFSPETGAAELMELYGKICVSCGSARYPQWYSGTLKLRLVCKLWSSVITNFYQSHPHRSQMSKDRDYNEEQNLEWTIDEFGKEDNQIQIFLDHFGQTPENSADHPGGRNPFIGRAVNLDYSNVQWTNEEPEQLRELLQKHGQHIWTCFFTINECYSTYVDLRYGLSLTPNVKNLAIECHPFSPLPNVDLSKKIQKKGIFNDLPPFLNLQSLRTFNIARPVLEAVIRKNNLLTILEINRTNVSDLYDLHNLHLQNVQQFSMKLYCDREFEALGTVIGDSPLVKLYLDFHEYTFVEWSRVFALLQEKWSGTLTSLKIKLPEARKLDQERKIMEECTSLRLNLPLVKGLKVTMSNFSNLDFILPLKDSLEFLDVQVKFDMGRKQIHHDLALEVERSQVIKFVDYQMRMLESNIWEIFTKLKKVDFCQEFDSISGRDYFHSGWNQVAGEHVSLRGSYTRRE